MTTSQIPPIRFAYAGQTRLAYQIFGEGPNIVANVTAATGGPPQFDSMVAALGMPTTEAVMPGPMDIDPGRVAEVCAAHGIDVLGPPPPPLD